MSYGLWLQVTRLGFQTFNVTYNRNQFLIFMSIKKFFFYTLTEVE